MNPHKNIRGLLNFRFLIILGLIIFFILMIAYFFYGLQPELSGSGPVQFKILKGESFREIGARLSRADLIKSIGVFKIYAIFSGRAQKFQPGLYELSGGMSVPQIVGTLTTVGKNEVSVTVPEGSSLRDIDSILSSAGIIEKGELTNFPLKNLANRYEYLAQVNSLEGFLFPDTYRFQINSEIEEVVIRFLANFQLKAWPMLSDKRNWYDLLILASFLEREVPEFNDRQIVAGVLLKRLRLGIPLQVDATISYVKCDGELKGCKEILTTKNDLTLPSPYNTYQRLGWTPTPISNPGEVAVKAAVTPRTSPYLYYLSSRGTKETIFSRTLEEHNINRYKYL